MSFSGSVYNIYNTSSSNITTIKHNNGNNINLCRNDKNIDSDNTSTNSLNNYMNNYYDNENESNNICTNSINNIQSSGNINLRDNNLSGDTISASYVANNDSDLGFSECNKSGNFPANNSEAENISGKKNSLQDSFDKGFNKLKEIKIHNVNRISVGQININSLRNKFEFLNEFVKGYIDILLITETKIDDSFPISQFYIEGFSTPFRLDRNDVGGGILLYVREDIPAKEINTTKFAENIEALFIEINLRKKKWLLSVSYNPHKELIEEHLREIGKNLDHCSG